LTHSLPRTSAARIETAARSAQIDPVAASLSRFDRAYSNSWEQRQFEADNSVDAYDKVVDRLLKDPRYGERWARHWMDIWRYSDWAGWSDGNQIRDSKPHIWRWRDWIIESLNNDKGYDRR